MTTTPGESEAASMTTDAREVTEATVNTATTTATTLDTPLGSLPYMSLAEWRHARGDISQADLAKRVSEMTSGRVRVHPDTVRNIERARALPSVDLARALARALEVLMDQIAWPTSEEVTSNASSRRSRYAKQQQHGQQ